MWMEINTILISFLGKNNGKKIIQLYMSTFENPMLLLFIYPKNNMNSILKTCTKREGNWY